MKNQTPLTSWKRFQLSLFSRGMLYTISSTIHLISFMIYLFYLSQFVSPFGYYNPLLWNGFYIVYTFIAIGFVWHGINTLRKFFKQLPDYVEEVDNRGYQTERIDRT